MNRSILAAFFCTVVLSSGCGFHTTPLVVGSAGGAAAGAGTGAIIGAIIANGDVGASALLGTAIGLPVGLALGAAYDYYYNPKTLEETQIEDIQRNQKEIFARQRRIDSLREEVMSESPRGNPPSDYRQYRYMGPSLGNPYR